MTTACLQCADAIVYLDISKETLELWPKVYQAYAPAGCLACLAADSPHLPWRHRDVFLLLGLRAWHEAGAGAERRLCYCGQHQDGVDSRSIDGQELETCSVIASPSQKQS